MKEHTLENVPASTLSALAQHVPVHPAAAAVAICQHRVSEKNFLRDNNFPQGAYLMTGTGIVPPDSFTLAAGDKVRITIDPIGTLENEVMQAK